jgi:hypothetical protein
MNQQKRIKTVFGVAVTAMAVLAMLAGGNVARGDIITRSIQVENDDAEEYLNTEAIHGWGGGYAEGNIDLSSSDLEVGDDEGDGLFWQVCAVQYDMLGIPKGSIINSAKLTFQVDEPGVSYTSNDFTILAEAVDNAAVFTTELFSISSRARSTASVAWNPPTSAAVGVKVDTSDIAALIQELVNRPGWSADNRLTLMIYPDAYLALPDPSTGGWTLVSANIYEAGPGLDSATLTIDYTVPEPASLSVLALGGLALLRRRRK